MVGRLQCIGVIPVLPGDSLEYHLDAIIRLTPLRKEIVQEGIIDIHAFYTPFRHVYPQISDMIKEGADEAQALTGISIPATMRTPASLGLNECGAALPRWVVQVPNRIWDRYYRVPTLDRIQDTVNGFDDYPSGPTDENVNQMLYGRLCSRLDSPLNGGTKTSGVLWSSQDLQDADAQAAAVATVDVRDIEKAAARYKSEIKRTWFSNDRYTDVLNEIWGTGVNIDADQRPELLWGDRSSFSGQDINGTDDATLGMYIGKTVARVNWHMPRRFFPEHGVVHIMALVRFPLIHWNECHPLMNIVNPDATFLLADPKIWSAMPPDTFNPSLWLGQQSAVSVSNDIDMPYGQHYRVQPNMVHLKFQENQGYPFEVSTMTTSHQYMYHTDGDYSPVFQNVTQLGHWQLHGAASCTVLRQVPEAADSINVGTH